jgi:uncharacterized repeat protein (TIGR01451 family)
MSNNSASVTHRITDANLSITKTGSPGTVGVGGRVTYTVQVSNHGPTEADHVRVTDDVPAGLAFVSATSSTGTCGGGPHVVCDLGTLGGGGVATITVLVDGQTVGTYTNTATVTSSTHDRDHSDNSASAVTHVARADLSLTKTAAPNPATVGRPLVYTLTVSNAGPSAATGVRIVDPLPPHESFVSAKPSQGTCKGGAVVRCELGTIAAGAKATVEIRVIPGAAGTTKNVATVASSTQDPKPQDNRDHATTTVTSADLSVDLRAAPDPVTVGDRLDYVAHVSNGGPTAASGVVVRISLPAGATLVAPDRCTGETNLTCAIGGLGVGGGATFTISVRPFQAGVMTARAHVQGGEFDRDRSNNDAAAQATARFGPTLAAVPAVGPPGFVTTAVGRGFPASTIVVLGWQPGIGRTLVRTDSAGRLRVPMLVLPHDSIGPRRLVAAGRAPDAAHRFAPIAAPFLVVAAALEPSAFVERR